MAYSREFFSMIDAPASVQALLPLLHEFVTPSSVVDFGCGTGGWLRGFMADGCQVVGLDGPWVDPAQLQIPPDAFRVTDLTRPVALERRFDLAVSLEVGEHLPDASAAGFVASLVAAAPIVLFSAAIPYQGGDQHINEQWPRYWSALFARHGYGCYDALRLRLWHHPGVEWWYAQNTMLFAEPSAVIPLLQVHHTDTPPSLVHPRAYIELHQGLARQWVPGALRRIAQRLKSRRG